jgi:DNA-binding SARP family transcriptional activator
MHVLVEAMQINILGIISVNVNGSRQQIPANKVRSMLAMLALDTGRPVSHADLAEELWSGQVLGNARNALQAHASRLRKVLDGPAPRGGATVLRSLRSGYLLNVPPESVDANRFLDLAARGSTALADHPQRALELLSAALGIWRGPALLDAGDGLRCRAAAALLEERGQAVWEDLITARLALGEERQAIAELRPLLARHPLSERFCEQLMLALYRCGRQSEALEVFHQTRRKLDAELGVQPGAGLQRRYTDILAQDPALVLPSAAYPRRSGHREPAVFR